MSSRKSSTISQEIRSALSERLAVAFRQVPRRKLWEWAEENVLLSPKTGTFSPGHYRTRHTPHIREVFEAFQDDDVREIILKFAAQTSKTLSETICIAWAIENDAGNMLFVMPSEQMAKSFSKSRLQQVILDSPSVSKHCIGSRSSFNLLEMELDNCVIALTGAGSASNLASRPIRYLFLDEIDKYPKSLGDEGNPAELAKERTKTFPNRKILVSSTPTTEQGDVSVQFEMSDKREWFVTCPSCGNEYILTWDCITFPKEGSDNERAESCGASCPSCKDFTHHTRRREFLSGGRWKPTAQALRDGCVGFHIAEISSCIGRPWPDLVRMFLSAQAKSKLGYHEDLKTFVCSVLADSWKVNTDTMRSSEGFYEFCQDYARGCVPTYIDIAGLTMGIDTQDNGFYYVVRAWGGGETLESWLIDCGFVNDFQGLEEVTTKTYPSEDGLIGFRIDGGFIDAMGHRTQEVYHWCRTIGRLNRIVPAKGERTISGGAQYSFVQIDKDTNGRGTKGGLQLCHINTTLFKDWLDGKLRIPAEDPGAWHIYNNISSDYVHQMSSEYRDEDGFWKPRTLQAANHLWDCETYALARAASLRYDKRRRTEQANEVQDLTNYDRRIRHF